MTGDEGKGPRTNLRRDRGRLSTKQDRGLLHFLFPLHPIPEARFFCAQFVNKKVLIFIITELFFAD